MHLQLEYCLVRMFAGRPFMLESGRDHTPTSSPNQHIRSPDTNPAPSGHNDEHRRSSISGRETLIHDCIQAAREALTVCQQLRNNGPGLARASYIEYSACRASLLALIAYSIQNPSKDYRGDISGGLDMIREMSAAGDSARSEVSLIETLEHALARLYAMAAPSHPCPKSNEPDSQPSDYEAFKEWGRIAEAGNGELGNPEVPPSRYLTDQLNSRHITQQSSMNGTTPFGLFNDVLGSNTDTTSGTHFGLDTLSTLESMANFSHIPDESMSPFLGWPSFTETQVLEQFLSNPGNMGS